MGSLKYHRLHPEYIYTRIRNLQGKYALRVLLTMVDITNHEDSLRELSNTSLINNVTLILCWSAPEAARYLELYKSYEHATFSAIKGQQAQGYADRLVEFVTVPRGVNKADAVSLVSNFGSLRRAINAQPDEIAFVGGWGATKVKRWSNALDEPFRVRRGATAPPRTAGAAATTPVGRAAAGKSAVRTAAREAAEPADARLWGPDVEQEEAELATAIERSAREAEERERAAARAGSKDAAPASRTAAGGEELHPEIAAALAKMRGEG